MLTAAVALWPDNFYCFIEDIPEFPHRSNDYEIIIVELDNAGEPILDL